MEKYWSCIGKAGFKVYKFALRRCPNQAPPPWITNPNNVTSKSTEEVEDDDKSADKENRDDNEAPVSTSE